LRVLTLTRLNEGDKVTVVVDAIDAVRGCDRGDPGTLILLRGGEIVKARELPDEVVRLMLLGD
jgi:hypothetical protein